MSFVKIIQSNCNTLFQSVVTSIFRPNDKKDYSKLLVQIPAFNFHSSIQSELHAIKQEYYERKNQANNDDFPTSPVKLKEFTFRIARFKAF